MERQSGWRCDAGRSSYKAADSQRFHTCNAVCLRGGTVVGRQLLAARDCFQLVELNFGPGYPNKRVRGIGVVYVSQLVPAPRWGDRPVPAPVQTATLLLTLRCVVGFLSGIGQEKSARPGQRERSDGCGQLGVPNFGTANAGNRVLRLSARSGMGGREGQGQCKVK